MSATNVPASTIARVHFGLLGQPPHFPPAMHAYSRAIAALSRAPARRMGSARLQLRPDVSFYRADAQGSPPRVAVLFGWINGTEKQLMKYADIYLRRGVSAVVVQPRARHVMQPAFGAGCAQDVAGFLEAEEPESRIFIHGFSVGGFLYGQLLRSLDSVPDAIRLPRDPGVKGKWASLVAGQFFDSAVDVEGVPTGLARAATARPWAQKLISTAVSSLLSLQPAMSREHNASSSAFRGHILPVPSAMLYSAHDLVADPAGIERAARQWRQRGVPVRMHRVEDSPHVQHLRHHADQYEAAVEEMLQGAR